MTGHTGERAKAPLSAKLPYSTLAASIPQLLQGSKRQDCPGRSLLCYILLPESSSRAATLHHAAAQRGRVQAGGVCGVWRKNPRIEMEQ